MSSLVTLTDATFSDEIQKSTQPILVDFYAPWCGPCKALAPILEELAAEYAGRLTIAKINIDDNGATSASFGVRSVPTLVFFKGGKKERHLLGLQPKSELKVIIDEFLK